jgi:hypothetical protein
MTLVSVAIAPNRSAAFFWPTADWRLLQRARRVFGLALMEQRFGVYAPMARDETTKLEADQSIPERRCAAVLSAATKKVVGGEDEGYFGV